MMILGVLLIIVIVIALGLAVSNGMLNAELSVKNTKLEQTKENLEDNITKLHEKSDLLNASNLFFNTYLQGLGTFYNATVIQETADYKMGQADTRYDTGYWSKALAWYWDATEWYNEAGQKFREAKKVFQNASEYALNSTYRNICVLYYEMMNVSSNAMIYAYEASDYYATACEHYLNNNYNAAHDQIDIAELKMTYHNEEIDLFHEYQEELNRILTTIN